MDYYTLAKFLHVSVAILWLGGAAAMIISGGRAMRAGASDDVLVIVRYTKFMADFIFMPGSVVMLLLGLYMSILNWSLFDAWVIIGILGVVGTGAIGALVLTPLVKHIYALPPGDEAAKLGRELIRKARADLVLLFVIVWDMVAKPGWQDLPVIFAMVVVVVVGGMLFLRGGD